MNSLEEQIRYIESELLIKFYEIEHLESVLETLRERQSIEWVW